MKRKLLPLLFLVFILILSGCRSDPPDYPFLSCVVRATENSRPLPEGTRETVETYFAWRGDSFGRAVGLSLPDRAPLLASPLRAQEESRTAALHQMMEAWGCLYSGADTTYRVDNVMTFTDEYLLNVYEFVYFNSWYPGITSPEQADRSGYGVKHVLTLRRTEAGWSVEGDDYDEGRPTKAASPSRLNNPAYREYAGIPSSSPPVVTGSPPLFESNAPVFSPAYAPAAAVAYADRWAADRNTALFGDYSKVGGDCCNFASQCLLAGGLPMDDTWYSEGGEGSVAFLSSTRLYDFLTRTGNQGKGMAVLRQGDPAGRTLLLGDKKTPAGEVLYPGSPVFYRWGGGYMGDGKWNHTALCVGYLGDGTPAISGHTGDKYHVKWNYGGADCDYGTVQMTAGP